MVEAAFAGETGCRILPPDDVDSFVFLFSESAGRVLLPFRVPRRAASNPCEARGLPAVRVGVSDPGSDSVEVQGLFAVSLEELRSTSEGVLPGLFG